MPARSVAQRKLIAIALHHPGKVKAKNRSILSMKREDMHDFAATKETGLARHVSQLKRKGKLKSKK
jgi:hypothetical protein